MKRFSPLLFLLLVAAANILILRHVEVTSTDWSRFFPLHAKAAGAGTGWFASDAQYLFIDCRDEADIVQWQNEGMVERYFEMPDRDGLYLLVFERAQQNRLLEAAGGYRIGGTSVIGKALMEAFIDELSFFIAYVTPFILLVLLLVTSLRYWVNILLEIGLYLLLLESLIVAIGFAVDPPALLAVVFLLLYALTLFNYLHSGEISRGRLLFGLTISLFTTALSALFLYFSDFGLLHTFGATMLLGLGALFVYMAARLYGLKSGVSPFSWVGNPPGTMPLRPLLLLFVLYLGVAWMFGKELRIDLNPVNLIGKRSPTYEKIAAFEKRYLPTLPFVVVFESTGEAFTLLHRARALAALGEAVTSQTTAVVLSSVSRAFSAFASQPLSGLEDAALYDQFILANDMFSSGMPLFSSDYKKAYMTLAIPITSSSETVNAIVGRIEALNGSVEGIRVEAVGKVADFEQFIAIFVREFLIGMGCSMLFTVLFFLWYCRAPKVLVVLAAALFSVVVLLGVHLLFALEITLLTLMTVILFTGLITDTLIHLFISYKHHGSRFFHPVYKPIMLSNVSMLIGLGGMMLSGSIMQRFALELAVLLGSNLFFVLYLMPRLLERYINGCSVPADSDGRGKPGGLR